MNRVRTNPNVNEVSVSTSDGATTSSQTNASFADIWNQITGSNGLLIVTHAHPDSDAVASVLAMTDLAVAHGTRVIPVVGDGELPETLKFMPGADRLRDPASVDRTEFDTILVVDCAELHRMGPFYRKHADWFDDRIPLLSIDHHITNSGFGRARIVDPAAAATCEVLSLMFAALQLPLSPDVATCLATGLYGDTLGLKTPSTTSRTLRVAADLTEAGADVVAIVDNLFRIKPFTTVKLWGLALNRSQLLGQLVWTEITPDMLTESGATAAEGEGIVNFIAGTREARASVLLYQNPSGWRASLRAIAEEINVAELAKRYGGGGHSRAAGCSLAPGIEARDAFLKDISERVSAPGDLE
jgi:phosphoesterase RecJ-like protein